MNFIVTFYAHFGAIRYQKLCKEMGKKAKLSPVPRNLSSSCGTCVRLEAETYVPIDSMKEEVEQVVSVTDTGYEVLYMAEDN